MRLIHYGMHLFGIYIYMYVYIYILMFKLKQIRLLKSWSTLAVLGAFQAQSISVLAGSSRSS